MIKIGHVKDFDNQIDLPKQIIDEIKKIVSILDTNYGSDRDINKIIGGYILIINSREDLKKISKDNNKFCINIKKDQYEFCDKIYIDSFHYWTNTLYILNNDFGIHVFIPDYLQETKKIS